MLNIVLLVVSYVFMEFVAWFTHKYVMHGFLWVLHRDHHVKPGNYSSFFEKNDYFFLIFALPAMILIIAGFLTMTVPLIFAGAGITLYGFTYFMIHEVVIHKRMPIKFNIRSRYMKALIKAHEAHHMPKNKDEFMSFGLLLFPSGFIKK